MAKTIEGNLDASGLRIGIVASRFNSAIVETLVAGALDAVARHGGDAESTVLAWVPGAYELPLVAQDMAETGSFDAVVCLGTVIRGATDHYVYVAGQTASGVAGVSLAAKIPVIFGVLTTDTIEQALERAGTKAGNKGWDAACAAIETVQVQRQIRALGAG